MRFLLLLAVAVPMPIPTMAEPDGWQRRAAAIFADLRPGEPGCAVGVLRDGKLAWAAGFGSADLAAGRPITADTVFDIASVSKQFTAFAVLQLEAAGKLALDDPIRRHLPELGACVDEVTIRHLLHHTGGLHDYMLLANLAGIPTTRRLTQQQALDLVSRQRTVEFPAGSEYSYSNTGYVLLAAIVERVSGEAMSRYAARHIFEPLGMDDSRLVDRYPAQIPLLAHAYDGAGGTGRFEVDESVWETTGDGAIHTNIKDMMKWVDNLATGAVGGPALAARMLETSPLRGGEPNRYAMGVFVANRRGHLRVSHSGAWGSYGSEMAWYPGRRLAVVVLANSSAVDAEAYADRVADLFLDPKPAAGRGGAEPPPGMRRADAPPPETIRPGDYADPAGRMLGIRRREGGLALDLYDQILPLERTAHRMLVADADQDLFVAARDADHLESNNPISTYERLAPWVPRDPTRFVGTFALNTTPGEIEVELQQGQLVAHAAGKAVALVPVAEDRFRTSEYGVITFAPDGSRLVLGVARHLSFARQPR